MIRFAWLRFRTQAAVAAACWPSPPPSWLVTGIRLAHAYYAAVAACKPRGDCAAARAAPSPSHADLTADGLLDALVLAVPGLIGMFWGAPLVAREFETGTFRLAWTQGVTRNRWLAAKLAVAGVASMAAAGLLSLMVTWWSSPIDRRTGQPAHVRHVPRRGIAPVGYAAFAFALGVTAGLLIRRTLPAMAVTLAVFAAVSRRLPRLGAAPPHPARPDHLGAQSRIGRGNGCRDQCADRRDLFVQTHSRTCPAPGFSPASSSPRPAVPPPAEPATQACGDRNATRPVLRRLHREPAPPADGDLPAREPLLALPVVSRPRSTSPSPSPWPGSASGGSAPAAPRNLTSTAPAPASRPPHSKSPRDPRRSQSGGNPTRSRGPVTNS